MRCSISFLLVKKFVYLHPFYYFCTMQQDNDSSASGYLEDSFEGISRTFTDVEILSTSEVNIVARAKRYGRWWLLKGLKKEVSTQQVYRQRLRKELEILMELQHPGIANAIGLESVGGLGECIVMEYLDGMTLKKWLEYDHPLKMRRKVISELTEIVDYIHKKGVVHRDLKPENIMITRNDGRVKLIDFGLADTDSHTVLKQPGGTPRYMSPEQKEKPQADVRNDIYSLGVIMEQMELGRSYLYIINRCKAPIENRYQDVCELQDAISKQHRLMRTGWALGGIAVVALLMVFVVWGVMSRVDSTEQQLTVQKDSVLKLKERVEEVTDRQSQQEDNWLRVRQAISLGKKAIDRKLAQTKMDKHIDTLSSILYLSPDFYTTIQNSGTFVDGALNEVGGNLTAEEMSEVKTALYAHLGKITEKWTLKIYKLKDAYDATFEE
jgi:serine/threonine protein kinase